MAYNNQRRNTTQAPVSVEVLTIEVASKYVKQMIDSVAGVKPTKAELFVVRLHVQANHNEVFKSLVLMPIIKNTNITLTEKYGKEMSAWCANEALRTLQFGRTHYSIETK